MNDNFQKDILDLKAEFSILKNNIAAKTSTHVDTTQQEEQAAAFDTDELTNQLQDFISTVESEIKKSPIKTTAAIFVTGLIIGRLFL